MKKLIFLIIILMVFPKAVFAQEEDPPPVVIDTITVYEKLSPYDPPEEQVNLWELQYGVITETDIADLPIGPWKLIEWHADGSWGKWQHTSEDGKIWIIQAHCTQPDQKAPYIGQEFYRDGSKLFAYVGQNTYQVMKIDFIIVEPEPIDWYLYLPFGQHTARGCSCDCIYANIVVNGKWVTRFPLSEYPVMNIIDFYLSIYPGWTVDVYYDFCHQTVDKDSMYQWSTVQINCDGKPSTTLSCDNVAGKHSAGYCPTFGCAQMNGTANCRITYSVQVCALCVARHEGNDPLERFE